MGGLDTAVNEEETKTVVMYIAFAEDPQPQVVAELERKMDSDTHPTDPLLLAYGALAAKASPDLQQRMTQFLLGCLSLAETNTSSLVHHILSLGNTESHHTAGSLVNYLTHPDHHVQLSSIHALRYATADSLVQSGLRNLVIKSNVTDEHLATIIHCLLFGLEHATNTHDTEKPFDRKLIRELFSAVMASENAELQQALTSYLNLVDNKDSTDLLNLMAASPHGKNHTADGARSKRDTYWADSNSVYNLVSPLSTRQSDVRVYSYHKSLIWGKKFGVSKGNVEVAAGGFVGASRGGGYKLFGRAKAVGHAFGRTKTALDFLVLRERKPGSHTVTRLYAEIIGKTLVNYNDWSQNTWCRRHSKPLHNPRKYTLFNFGFSVFIYVGTLRFHLAGYVKLNTDLYVNFCDARNKITANAGVLTTVTMELEAGATANLLVRKCSILPFLHSVHSTCYFTHTLCLSVGCTWRYKCQCSVQLQCQTTTVDSGLPDQLSDEGEKLCQYISRVVQQQDHIGCLVRTQTCQVVQAQEVASTLCKQINNTHN